MQEGADWWGWGEKLRARERREVPRITGLLAHSLASGQSCSAQASQTPVQAHTSECPSHWATYLPLLIADPLVELLALNAQKVLPRMDDATLDCDSPGCVDIVAGDHADCDACPLALSDGFWDLSGRAGAMGVSITLIRPSLPL